MVKLPGEIWKASAYWIQFKCLSYHRIQCLTSRIPSIAQPYLYQPDHPVVDVVVEDPAIKS